MTIPQSNPVTDAELDAIESYLRDHATERAVTTDELADAVDITDAHDTNPTVRQAVQYLLFEGRLCVDGTSQGYRVVTDEARREEAVQSLREQIGTLNRRVQALKDAPLAGDGEEATTSDGPTCKKCGGAIAGEPWLWYSTPLCQSCYDERPTRERAFTEWVEGSA
jgi:hypothetical protein